LPDLKRTSSEPKTPILANVQALRAVAVASVVIYHFWPDQLTGGYIGVDVFFVISGFLITAHLVREARRDSRISLPQFYSRRARRLLPAAFVVIGATALATMAWVPITRWISSFEEFLASAVYLENWALIAKSTNYLQMTSAPSPMQHYWSLSVEEQFYLVWPLLIVLAILVARRFGANWIPVIRVIMIALVAGSLAWGVWTTFTEPQAAYFSTFARAWEFGAGALVALFPVRGSLPRWAGGILSWLGLAGIIACDFLYNDLTPFPGWAAVVVVVATVAVIVAGNPESRYTPTGVYRLRPVQFIGDISYSIYLWHWPIVVIAPYALHRDLDLPTSLLLLVLTLALSTATKFWVEDPVRRARWLQLRKPRWSLIPVAVAMGLLVVGSLGGVRLVNHLIAAQSAADRAVEDSLGVPIHFDDVVSRGPDAPLLPSPIAAASDVERNSDCWSQEDDDRLIRCSYEAGTEGALRVALVGDSHAEQFSGAFIALAKAEGWSLDTYFKQACSWGGGPMLKPGASFAENCESYRTKLNAALRGADYDVIITTSAVYRVEPVGSEQAFVRTWRPLLDAGTKIYVIADNPHWPADPVDCLVAARDPGTCDLPRTDALPWPDPQVLAAAELGDVPVIDLTDRYCDATTCFATIDRMVVYRDNDHFTRTFVRSLAPYLLHALEGAGFPRIDPR
jgi:peptidoglycan/LPS O-acetylase OafA/YrhL